MVCFSWLLFLVYVFLCHFFALSVPLLFSLYFLQGFGHVVSNSLYKDRETVLVGSVSG